MKKAKKLLALILTLTVALTMGASVTGVAFGANNTYSITIDNAVNGETYTAYKIFDVTYSGENSNPGQLDTAPDPDSRSQHTAYAYEINSSSEWWSVVTNGKAAGSDTFTANGLTFTKTSKAGVYNVSATTSFDAAAFAVLLDGAKAEKTSSGSATAENGTATIDVNPDVPGYYFVDTSTGSLCSLDTTEPSATIREKNVIPSQDKKQAVGSSAPTTAGGYVDAEQQVQVGDTVWYQIEVKDGKGTDAAIAITDVMSDGLTFDTSSNPTVVASINGGTETAVATDNYTVSDKTAQGFKVTLKADYVKTLTEKDIVYIRFSAVVNSKAASDTDAEKETNTSTLTYSHQSSKDSVDVVTYKFQLDKVKNATHNYEDLLGAQFELYRGSKADGNKIWFIKGTATGDIPVLIVAGEGAKAPATGAFSNIALTNDTTVENYLGKSKVIIKGLDQDTYVLHEIQAPAGYNIADDTEVPSSDVLDVLVKINGTITDTVAAIGDDDTGVVSVVNNEGTELPATGGIGTTIFYILGALLVIVCGVVLVARRRMAAK